MNYSQLKSEVFLRIEEDADDPQFWDLGDVEAALNEAWRDLAMRTMWCKSVVTIPLQSEVTYYDLRLWVPEPGLLRIDRVWDRSTERWLTPTMYPRLRSRFRSWESVTGHPKEFFVRKHFWLGIWPKPTVSDTDHNSVLVDVYTTVIPFPLGAEDYSPPFPERFQIALLDYAGYELKSQEGETEAAVEFFEDYANLSLKMLGWTRKQLLNIPRGHR